MATYDDPRILRAIAHPARGRILAELHAAGPLRAADVARALDIPPNQASFHLRQLAKYGLVEEAPEEARDKRDRVWRMVSEEGLSFRLHDVAEQPGGSAAVSVFRRNARAWGHHLVDSALSEREGGPEVAMIDSALRLTQEEVVELTADLDALQQRWHERTRGRDEDRTTYSLYVIVQPLPEHADRADQADGAGGSEAGD